LLKPLHIETWFNVCRSWRKMSNYCSNFNVLM